MTDNSVETRRRRTSWILVEFEGNVPDGAPEAEPTDRESAEASAGAKLADEGHIVRLWMHITLSPLAPRPNDPAATLAGRSER